MKRGFIAKGDFRSREKIDPIPPTIPTASFLEGIERMPAHQWHRLAGPSHGRTLANIGKKGWEMVIKTALSGQVPEGLDRRRKIAKTIFKTDLLAGLQKITRDQWKALSGPVGAASFSASAWHLILSNILRDDTAPRATFGEGEFAAVG